MSITWSTNFTPHRPNLLLLLFLQLLLQLLLILISISMPLMSFLFVPRFHQGGPRFNAISSKPCHPWLNPRRIAQVGSLCAKLLDALRTSNLCNYVQVLIDCNPHVVFPLHAFNRRKIKHFYSNKCGVFHSSPAIERKKPLKKAKAQHKICCFNNKSSPGVEVTAMLIDEQYKNYN